LGCNQYLLLLLGFSLSFHYRGSGLDNWALSLPCAFLPRRRNGRKARGNERNERGFAGMASPEDKAAMAKLVSTLLRTARRLQILLVDVRSGDRWSQQRRAPHAM
jgi:hypothetical protein